MRLDFGATGRSPKRLIEAKGIAKAYGERRLFSGVDLLIGPGTRIGLLGPNGCGKSTLLKVLLGKEAPDAGTVTASDLLAVATFEQGRESLDPDASVVDTVAPAGGDQVDYRGRFLHVRSYLDRFLFSSEQMEMKVGRLSGGEQSRLLLARLMLRPANLLVLDEPTNDLDLATLNVLEECLLDFPGAILLVTHDRYFLDRVTTQILAFGQDADGAPTLTALAGLDQWEAWRLEPKQKPVLRATGAAPTGTAPARKKRLSYKDQRDLDTLEPRISAVEERLAALRAACERPEVASDATRLLSLMADIGSAQAELDRLYARWAELSE